MTTRYVWLEIATGRFSDPWSEAEEIERQRICKEPFDHPIFKGWKLIRYECLTDDTFEFNKRRRIR